MPLDVGGFRLRVTIDPGSIGVVFAVDADGVIAGSSLPRADTGVSTRLKELLPDRFGRKVGVSIYRMGCVGFSDDFSVPDCAWHTQRLGHKSAKGKLQKRHLREAFQSFLLDRIVPPYILNISVATAAVVCCFKFLSSSLIVSRI